MSSTPRQHRHFLASTVPSFLGGLAVFASTSLSALADTWFDPAFFKDDPSLVADLSRFEKGQQIAPGRYRVDVIFNQIFVATRDIEFVANEDNHQVEPCLNKVYLSQIGVKTAAFPAFNALDDDACVPLAKVIPDASVKFDARQLQLAISVPQIAVKNDARGYVPPERWDRGINALLLGYSFSGANGVQSSNENGGDNNYFLNLNSGLNLAGWRLRNNSTWSYGQDEPGQWQNISSYAQYAIIPVKGELTVGDSYTGGDFFDSVGFRGVQLASDDNMLPDSLRGFAPTVRGIAKSNAQVTIKQNGYTVYQTYVPPGAFEINDLFSSASSGDLQVEIKESDGTLNRYTIPYSSVPLLQRQGRLKYALTAANYRSNSNDQDEKAFAQATLQWGGPWGVTWYGGGQFSDDYRAGMLGLGFNLGEFGAVSVDGTWANSTLANNQDYQGQSWRFLYAKTLNPYGTNFQLMGYRYSTSGFYTLADTMYHRMEGYTQSEDDETPLWARYYNLYYSKRGKLQINISQQLGDYGSFYLSGSEQTYWNTDDQDRLLQFGYNTQIKDVTLGLSWNYSQSRGQPSADQVFALNVSLPLGQWLSSSNGDANSRGHAAWMTSNTSADNDGNVTQNVGISGSLLDDDNLSYSVQQGYVSQGESASGNASLDYKGSWGESKVGYNYSDNGNQQQVNYGVSGSVIVHSEGVTLGQSLGETNVLVSAPGAENTKVANYTGISTDGQGNSLLPYATPYRENRIALDTASLKQNVDIENAVVNVVPTKGALVRARFSAHVGARVLFSPLMNGKPLRFGAMATLDDADKISGIVDDDGSLYMSGLPEKGSITVRWGDAREQQCQLTFTLTAQQMAAPITRRNAVCE
ncbi:fimbrial biogenesis usher protein [Pseudocitrobacter faecalis]|uniref:Outer membrane usher protein n=1 Tax=Pseudocitrobacter faecalis TaxID=1398493 RepID=A0ABX9G025_9ENTR|nr:outer membrane usher protein [Pseudocitrobacter faecalis]